MLKLNAEFVRMVFKVNKKDTPTNAWCLLKGQIYLNKAAALSCMFV